MTTSILIWFLACVAFIKGQQFEDGGYYQLKSGESIQIANKEFPNGYPFGSARQITVRAPFFCNIHIECSLIIGHGYTDCDSANGMYFLGDGTRYLNNSRATQVCDYQKIYEMTTTYNDLEFGHYSTDGPDSQTGAYICTVKAVPQTYCDCGWKSEARIVGGTVAPTNGYPCMAAIMGNDGTLHGGGTIISTNAILTSAHTILDSDGNVADLSTYSVELARQNIAKNVQDDTPYSLSMKIADYRIHPSFRDDGSDLYDLAILLTDKYIPLSKAIAPCCIPNPQRDRSIYDYKNVILLGWGSIEFGYPYSNELLRGITQVYPNEQCFNNSVTSSKMCTRSTSDRVDSCQGDSGGPVLYSDPTINRLMVLGVTESGVGCGEIGIEEFVASSKDWMISDVPADNQFCLYD